MIPYRKNIIVAESHRLFSEEMKQIMGARCLSFTFLPYFAHNYRENEHLDLDGVHIGVSSPKTMRMDDISSYELEKRFVREYQRNIVPLILSMISEDSEIILAQDNDAGGNMMASLLKYKLEDAGIHPMRIKRMIGAEFTIRNNTKCLDLYMGTFYSKKLLVEGILKRYRQEYESIREYGKIDIRLKKGYRNIIALYRAFMKAGTLEEIIPKSKGISLATYLVNGTRDHG